MDGLTTDDYRRRRTAAAKTEGTCMRVFLFLLFAAFAVVLCTTVLGAVGDAFASVTDVLGTSEVPTP